MPWAMAQVPWKHEYHHLVSKSMGLNMDENFMTLILMFSFFVFYFPPKFFVLIYCMHFRMTQSFIQHGFLCVNNTLLDVIYLKKKNISMESIFYFNYFHRKLFFDTAFFAYCTELTRL